CVSAGDLRLKENSMRKYLNWQAWLIVAALAGCGGSDAAPSGVDVGVELALTSGTQASGGGPLVAAADSGEVKIEHARTIVERIDLYLPTGKSDACQPGADCEKPSSHSGSGGGSGSEASDD